MTNAKTSTVGFIAFAKGDLAIHAMGRTVEAVVAEINDIGNASDTLEQIEENFTILPATQALYDLAEEEGADAEYEIIDGIADICHDDDDAE